MAEEKMSRVSLETEDPQDSNSAENCSDWEKRPCSELPPEILGLIANRLETRELLRFRVACKEWRSASSNATAEIGSTLHPWFLMYGGGSTCSLYIPREGSHTITIPELEGARCIASNDGWLLLHREGLVFFFCPFFPKQQLDLPKFPHVELTDHVAAISSTPTSSDCIVCVINRRNNTTFELNLLCRGDREWTKHEYYCIPESMGTITSATFYNGVFYFLESNQKVLTFIVKDEHWVAYRIITSTAKITSREKIQTLPFATSQILMDNVPGADKLVSICGTQIMGNTYNKVIQNVQVESAGVTRNQRRGVWFHSRYHQVPQNRSWSL